MNRKLQTKLSNALKGLTIFFAFIIVYALSMVCTGHAGIGALVPIGFALGFGCMCIGGFLMIDNRLKRTNPQSTDTIDFKAGLQKSRLDVDSLFQIDGRELTVSKSDLLMYSGLVGTKHGLVYAISGKNFGIIYFRMIIGGMDFIYKNSQYCTIEELRRQAHHFAEYCATKGNYWVSG